MNRNILSNVEILKAFENKSQVDVIFTDLTKALGRVDYNFLSESLYKSGYISICKNLWMSV